MKFDLHSMSSNMSHISNFAHNVPHLVQRRGGLVHPAAGTLRRYSDSGMGMGQIIASCVLNRSYFVPNKPSGFCGR